MYNNEEPWIISYNNISAPMTTKTSYTAVYRLIYQLSAYQENNCESWLLLSAIIIIVQMFVSPDMNSISLRNVSENRS